MSEMQIKSTHKLKFTRLKLKRQKISNVGYDVDQLKLSHSCKSPWLYLLTLSINIHDPAVHF